MATKTKQRRCGYRQCRKPLGEDKNKNARFCDDRCRNYERNAALAEAGKCRACGRKLALGSKVYCQDHLKKNAAYKRKSESR